MILETQIQASIENPRYVQTGCFGEVYRFSERICGKMLYENTLELRSLKLKAFQWNLLVKKLKAEHRVNKELYDAGFPVPMPFGVYGLEISGNHQSLLERKERPIFVMEYFEGIMLRDISDMDLYLRIRSIASEEANEALELGFQVPGDYNSLKNILYNPLSDRICFVDFGAWGKRDNDIPSTTELSNKDKLKHKKIRIPKLDQVTVQRFESKLESLRV